MRVMRDAIRFGLAYSPLWERSTHIPRAYHDVILLFSRVHVIAGQRA